MKILCVIDSLGSGGAQRQLVELAIGFKKRGHEVTFLIYHPIYFFAQYLKDVSIPIVSLDEGNYLKRILKVRSFIRMGKYDSVLSFLEAPNFICEISRFPYSRWKLVVGERSANPFITKGLKTIFYRLMHFSSNYVVANSTANIDLVRRANPFLSKEKCQVIYNIVDFNKWRLSDSANHIQDDRIHLMVVASHHHLKNLKGLIHGVALLSKEEREKIKISWYGGRRDHSLDEGLNLIEALDLSGIFNFFDATSEIQEKVQQADIVGLFSFYEGFPNAICEAMACGKPVICSKVSDLPIILANTNNIFCDPNSVHSISDGLRKLLTYDRGTLNSIGKGNLAIAVENFSETINVEKYLKLLS